jgi:hypothetical protein
MPDHAVTWWTRRARRGRRLVESSPPAGQDPLPSAGDLPSGEGLQLITGKTLTS